MDEEFSVRQWALFAEDEWWITPDFALTGGLRMDDHEIYGSHFSPRGYAVWHATEQLTFKGGISTGFRAPELRTIAPGYAYTTGGAGCSYGPNGTCGVIIGDPDLQPEKAQAMKRVFSGTTSLAFASAQPISTRISKTRSAMRW